MSAPRTAEDALRPNLWKWAFVIAVSLVSCAGRPALAQECVPDGSPKILVLRGVFEIFSLGMNDLAHKLRCRGYDATSTSWSLALFSIDCSGDRPIIVIGHSLGGRMCGWTSRLLKSCGQRVPLIIVVDANLLTAIPSNVDECLNLYVTNELGIFHGSPVRAESPHTHVVNWDVSRGQPSMFLGGVNHFDIDATDWVHDIIIREIEGRFPLCPTMPEDVCGHFSLSDRQARMVSPIRLTTSNNIASAESVAEEVHSEAPLKLPFDSETVGQGNVISRDDAQLVRLAEVTICRVLGPDEEDPFDAEERRNKRDTGSNGTHLAGLTESTIRIARVPWQPTRPRVVNSQPTP